MRYLLILLLLAGIDAGAQTKNYILSPKGDTLNRIDGKGKKQGPWVIQVPEIRGERGYDEEGFYENDQKEGIWRRFSAEGDMLAMETYHLGMKHGKCMYFTNSGEILREESWKAIDPNHPYDTVDILDVNDPSKVVRKEIVKVEPNSYKHGHWTYYNTMDGSVEKTEDWVMDKPKQTEAVAGTEDLAPLDLNADGADKSTAKKDDKKATSNKPQAVLDFEKKNAGKKKTKLRDGQTGN